MLRIRSASTVLFATLLAFSLTVGASAVGAASSPVSDAWDQLVCEGQETPSIPHRPAADVNAENILAELLASSDVAPSVRASAAVTVCRLDARPTDDPGSCLVTYGGITAYLFGNYIVRLTPTEEQLRLSLSEEVVALAMEYLGAPYKYGASGPKAFDCSGFTSYIYKQFGFSINRTASYQLLYNGTAVSKGELQPGDLVFFRDPGASKPATHVGIYIGGGKFIHAASTATGRVVISSLSSSYFAPRYVGAKRIL